MTCAMGHYVTQKSLAQGGDRWAPTFCPYLHTTGHRYWDSVTVIDGTCHNHNHRSHCSFAIGSVGHVFVAHINDRVNIRCPRCDMNESTIIYRVSAHNAHLCKHPTVTMSEHRLIPDYTIQATRARKSPGAF